MRTITLFLCAALAVTSIDAASYEQTDGTIVDPILDVHGNVHSYSGNNLEAGANLDSADLSGSILTDIQYYIDDTWTDVFYDYPNEPTWDSGMDAAWRSSVGILRTTPEPGTLLLALFGLALLPRRRRR